MDWMKILSAIMLVTLIVLLWPRAKQMLENSPKGTAQDWQSAIIPLAMVVGFVVLLVIMVRG